MHDLVSHGVHEVAGGDMFLHSRLDGEPHIFSPALVYELLLPELLYVSLSQERLHLLQNKTRETSARMRGAGE